MFSAARCGRWLPLTDSRGISRNPRRHSRRGRLHQRHEPFSTKPRSSDAPFCSTYNPSHRGEIGSYHGMLLIATVHSDADEYKSVCYDKDKYQIFCERSLCQRRHGHLLRTKKNNIDTDNCNWDRRKGDVWISENKGKYSEDAKYVIGVRNDFVLMDSGTGGRSGANFRSLRHEKQETGARKERLRTGRHRRRFSHSMDPDRVIECQ